MGGAGMSTALVTRPGVYDIEENAYHADPCAPELGRSLSYSGAKALVPPNTPAKFHYEREHGRAPKPAYDFGHAAHELILGTGLELVVVDAEDWRTKAAQQARKDAYAAGKCPLLKADAERARAIADSVLTHPTVGAILSQGEPERSIFWIDQETGVTRRARPDWLRSNAIVDIKTCQDASPGKFAKSCADFGYAMQDAWYTDAVEAVGLGRLPFIFVAVEKDPPHLVGIYQLDAAAEAIGENLNRMALRIYAECESSGEWPGYSTDIETLQLPAWYARTHE
jgi:hypothetical protein